MALTRDEELQASLALTEEEIAAYVERCPEQHQAAFEGWLRGKRHLDGDPILPDENGSGANGELSKDVGTDQGGGL